MTSNLPDATGLARVEMPAGNAIHAGTRLAVMTQNMDEGTNYQSLSEATDVPTFLAAVTKTY